jgi:hypothetical protein
MFSFHREKLLPNITMRNISKNSFIEALEARKDDVYVRILQDVSSLDCIRCEDLKILYHHACYRHKNECFQNIKTTNNSTEQLKPIYLP